MTAVWGGGEREKVRKKLKTRVNKITRHRSPAAAPNFDVRLSDESKIVICLANAQLQLHRK